MLRLRQTSKLRLLSIRRACWTRAKLVFHVAEYEDFAALLTWAMPALTREIVTMRRTLTDIQSRMCGLQEQMSSLQRQMSSLQEQAADLQRRMPNSMPGPASGRGGSDG